MSFDVFQVNLWAVLVSGVVYFAIVAVALNAFGARGIAEGVFVGAVVWFGFSLLPTIIHYAYEDRTLSLLAINKGYDFIGIEVAAIILSVSI
jgi:hypothetical protein